MHLKNILIYIQQNATLRSLLLEYLGIDLHVSGVTSTHHLERKQLYLQHLVFVTPLLLHAAIMEELEIRCNVTQYITSISGNCSTCFGCYLHSSSVAQTTVSTASGICHTVTATCRYHGRIGNPLQRYKVYYEYIWELLYMFRVVPPPIIRSTNNYIYSIWYHWRLVTSF